MAAGEAIAVAVAAVEVVPIQVLAIQVFDTEEVAGEVFAGVILAAKPSLGFRASCSRRGPGFSRTLC